jgi:nitrite reductase/ring-hydroxylating ferredoxin subunit
MTHEEPMSRRSVLIGVGVASAAVLTGCARYGPGTGAVAGDASGGDGSGGSGGAGDGAAGGDSATGGNRTGGDSLATAAVPVGGGVVLGDRRVVVTQPKAGEFKAFTAICTHQGCTVAQVRDGTINCPCHGSRFNAADGSVVNGPAAQPLRPIDIRVSAGRITFD